MHVWSLHGVCLVGTDCHWHHVTPWRHVCPISVATGTVAFLPTVITASIETYRHVLPLLAAAAARRPGVVLGLHLEGPFLEDAPGARGCHLGDLIRDPDVGLLTELLELADGRTRLLTVAAGRPGVEVLIAAAVAAGVTVALGHHLATYAQLEAAADAGASMLTHLGNGVPNEVHRHTNPVVAGLGAARLAASIITDGFHLPKAAIAATIYAKAGRGGVVVVSDAVWLAGLPAGVYRWMGKEISLEQDAVTLGYVVRDPGNNCLAGSAASMLQCANHLWDLNIVPDLSTLEDMVFHGPLRLVGLSAADVDCCRPRVRNGDGAAFMLIDPAE